MFPSYSSSVHFPTLETEIIKFWKERKIYEKSLAQRADAPRFLFYEGPPTANGMPHPGHCMNRSIKDLFPRYRTMRGYRCERKAGWDTHGLPVEVEVCKELGIHSKEEIESYGVEPFIHKCQESVWRYMQEWERVTERLGFWIHLEEAYVTYHQSFVESVWWSLKNLYDRGLLYNGHKIVWWWAQGGTALSSGEVGEGYREVADPSVYVRFPLLDESGQETDEALLVWTTTPWTLPGNQFAAVNPELEYVVIESDHEPYKLIVARDRIDDVAKLKTSGKPGPVKASPTSFQTSKTYKGKDLIRRRYRPPFDYFYKKDGVRRGRLFDDTYPEKKLIRLAYYQEQGFTSDEYRIPLSMNQEFIAWRVVGAKFVTTDSGTGVVHIAPAFGDVDFEVLAKEAACFLPGEGPSLLCPVAPDGTFTSEAPDYEGQWVKDADKQIIRDLGEKELLFHRDQYLHEYPFCWRAEEDPLIQYPRQSWFIRTTQFKDQLLANNDRINWLPEHIQHGRFGNFLESNVDWALSRERYWGTPLPIWKCEATGQAEAVASYDELLAKPGVQGTEFWLAAKQKRPDLSEHLKVHKPYIDLITYDSPFAAGKRMRRVPEVIDCWYDSGAMPFAQWGYPHQGVEQFRQSFPADFISEALDQTRGWFYSLLAISTLLFGRRDDEPSDELAPPADYPHPFRTCIVSGLILGEDGKKMSKQKRNYREPGEIFDRYGADALRWYFFANQPPWTAIRYSEQAIKDSVPEFLLRLWNVYSFFVIYANIDGFEPAKELTGYVGQLGSAALSRAKTYRPVPDRGELDRWILSDLHRTAAAVVQRMDAYDNYGTCQQISAFVEGLSNWYVRLSRERFWSGEQSSDKRDAYWTLYECLLTTAKLVAPFLPFLAERLWRDLAVTPFGQRVPESVHLCDYPPGEAGVVDPLLSARMSVVREIVSLGRSARMEAKLKVRQPLSKVEVVLVDLSHQPWLESHAELIAKELNVKTVDFAPDADQYITFVVLPNLKRLGPRLGRRLPALKQALTDTDGAALMKTLEAENQVEIPLADGPVALDWEDIQVRLQAKKGWSAAQGTHAVVIISTELNDELIAEGHAREFVHAVQNRRREIGCEYTDRIAIGLETDARELTDAVRAHRDYITAETLCERLEFKPLAGAEGVELTIAGFDLKLFVKVVKRKHSP
jgi:isoleucyl-tRNA synthetase